MIFMLRFIIIIFICFLFFACEKAQKDINFNISSSNKIKSNNSIQKTSLQLTNVNNPLVSLSISNIINEVNKLDILKEEGILESNKKKIGIALRDLSVVLPPSSAEEALRQLANSLNKLKDDCEFIFIPQSTYKEDDDRITARKFVQRLDSDLKYYIINHRYDPREIVGLYAYCDATLSIRLHGAVFSAIAGTPVIAMNYLPKVEGFMKSIGMDRFLINVDHIREELLLELFQEVLKNKNNLSEKINKEMNIKRKLVSQYAELAISLLYGDQNETKEG